MQLPLFLGTPNREGQKGATVSLFTGNWIIELDSPLTKVGLILNDSDPVEIENLHRLEVKDKTNVCLVILKPCSSPSITAFAGRVH